MSVTLSMYFSINLLSSNMVHVISSFEHRLQIHLLTDTHGYRHNCVTFIGQYYANNNLVNDMYMILVSLDKCTDTCMCLY